MKNTAFSSKLVTSLLLGLLVSACGGNTRTRPQTCSSDAQCTGGKVCQSGTCTTPPSNPTSGCSTSNDCQVGEVCDAGKCISNDGGSCQTAMDCPEDQYCQAHVCVDGGGTTNPTCTTTADCTGGKKCNTYGECVACTKDTDCGTGKKCSSGYTCVAPTCTSDTDCGTGSKCKKAAQPSYCVQCLSDADCATRAATSTRASSAKVCRNDMCTDPSTSCTTNAQCNGYVCTASNGQCTQCTSDSQCGTGNSCNTSTGKCYPTGTNPTCNSPTDCNGLACVSGTCQRCTQDSECTTASGTTTTPGLCDGGTGKCGPVQCTSASQCAAGEACYSPGRCGPCVADSECRTGEYCVITGTDTTGWCQTNPGSSGSCTSNAQCAQDLVCYQGQCTTCLATSECDSCEYCTWNGRCITESGGSCTPTSNCTSNTQCPVGTSCVAGYCTTTGGGGGTVQFGGTCTNNAQCAFGLTCAGFSSSQSICTRTCVGSGNGGNDDCPSGYGCVDWESTTLDGLKICYSASQLGTSSMGYPFTTPPGGSCNASAPYQNSCQTSVCTGYGTCAELCNGNSDCDWGDVCYAYPDQSIGWIHECWPSDTTNYLAAGYQCNDNTQCDSGICLGQCTDGNPCGSDYDCSNGQGCFGTCVDHCRSVNDCPSDSACNFWPMYITGGYAGWTPVCSGRIYNGSVGLGSACSTDADCDSEWCISGVCTTPCATTSDCSGGLSGYACTPVNFYSGSSPVYSGSFCL